MNNEVDLDTLMLDFMMVRLSLENLVFAVKEGDNVAQMLRNATTALQWTMTSEEVDNSCEDCQ